MNERKVIPTPGWKRTYEEDDESASHLKMGE
jgi:hypothetical protein